MRPLLDNSAYCVALNRVAECAPDLSRFKRGIIVTGASGLVGSAVVDLLLHMRGEGGFDGRVIAVGRSIARLDERFGCREGLTFAKYSDVINGEWLTSADGFVLAASPASPNLFLTDPNAVVKANTVDVEKMLSAIRQTVARVVYVSSSEVYGDAVASEGGHVEESLGRIDTADVRSCYAVSKRKAEEICGRFAHDGLDVVVVRPGHIYGPTALKSDRRVSSAWAYSAACGEDIVMKSDGCQLRSYTHCLDCASAILTALVKGKRGEAYNISNHDSVVTIRQLAEILAAKSGVSLRFDMPSLAERTAFNPMSNSSLNASKLEALGWHGVFDAESGLMNTVQALKEMQTGEQQEVLGHKE